MIHVENLNKTIQKKEILKDINFDIKAGEVVALVGPNGAGKTTLISCLVGLMKASSGVVELFGKSPQSKATKNRLGVMMQENSAIEKVKVKEMFQLFRSYYPNGLSVAELLELSDLKEHGNTYTTKLSGGQKRRLAFALAMVGQPDLIFLDEPTVGMDVTSRQLFWDRVQGLTKQGKSIILTTHYLEEIEKVATRILLIKKGELIHDGTMKSLQSEMLLTKICFEARTDQIEQIQRLPYVEKVECEGNRVMVHSNNSDETLIELMGEKIFYKNLKIIQGSLEDVFTTMIEEENKEAWKMSLQQ